MNTDVTASDKEIWFETDYDVGGNTGAKFLGKFLDEGEEFRCVGALERFSDNARRVARADREGNGNEFNCRY